MNLSYNKFMLEGTDMETVDLRCTVCGRSTKEDVIRLDEALEWADKHKCARMRVT
jgi:hypothetical protein